MNSILIIGSSNKVSKELMELYARHGFNIIMTWNRTELDDSSIKKIKEKYKIDIKSIKLDLMDFNSHKPFCDSIADDLIGIITTSGYYPDQQRAGETNEELIKCININYLGLCSVINIISNTFENRKKGFIVGISSVSGERGRKKNYIYGSSKSGFTAYLGGLRNRLYDSGVHVMTVIPGYIKETNQHKSLSCTAESLANIIFTSQQKRRDVIYVKWYWRYIMFLVKIIPEFIFKKTNI
tara:strand:+ start:2651 stop:3367 length:717 start_codon:yes stop_codon:yes gene_type:complete